MFCGKMWLVLERQAKLPVFWHAGKVGLVWKEQVSASVAGMIPAADIETPDDALMPEAQPQPPNPQAPQPPIREGRDCI